MTPWKKGIYQTWYTPKPWVSSLRRNTWCPMFGVPSEETPKSMFLYIDVIIYLQYSDIESRSHPPSRIDPQSRIRVPISWNQFGLPRNQGYPKMAVLFWEIRGTWMLIPWDLDHPPNHVGHARRHRRRNHYLRASSDSPKNLYSSWPCSVKQLNSGG